MRAKSPPRKKIEWKSRRPADNRSCRSSDAFTVLHHHYVFKGCGPLEEAVALVRMHATEGARWLPSTRSA